MNIVYVNSINIANTTFNNNKTIVNVNCNNRNWSNDSAVNAFAGCTNLQNVTGLTNTIADLSNTFYACTNLTTIPTIPDSVVTMNNTFEGCYNITTVSNIPTSVTNMRSTFDGCTNLTGDIYIESADITNASNCFNNTTATKNVYIPFIYSNGEHTSSYNAFVAAGYDINGTRNGVYLKSITRTVLDISEFAYTSTGNDEITLTNYTGNSTNIVVPGLEVI